MSAAPPPAPPVSRAAGGTAQALSGAALMRDGLHIPMSQRLQGTAVMLTVE